jgi:hypothetical protein
MTRKSEDAVTSRTVSEYARVPDEIDVSCDHEDGDHGGAGIEEPACKRIHERQRREPEDDREGSGKGISAVEQQPQVQQHVVEAHVRFGRGDVVGE